MLTVTEDILTPIPLDHLTTTLAAAILSTIVGVVELRVVEGFLTVLIQTIMVDTVTPPTRSRLTSACLPLP